MSYVCIDGTDGSVEESIIGSNGFRVTMLGATAATDLSKEDALRTADVVALWHTVVLDERTLAMYVPTY